MTVMASCPLQASLGGQHHTSQLVADRGGIAAWHQHFSFIATAPCAPLRLAARHTGQRAPLTETRRASCSRQVEKLLALVSTAWLLSAGSGGSRSSWLSSRQAAGTGGALLLPGQRSLCLISSRTQRPTVSSSHMQNILLVSDAPLSSVRQHHAAGLPAAITSASTESSTCRQDPSAGAATPWSTLAAGSGSRTARSRGAAPCA